MLTIEMLPAGHGDCLWVEYGSPQQPHRILVDGGPAYAYQDLKATIEARKRHMPPGRLHFDLLIITHIDDDHLGGILALLADPSLDISFGDVWFNGWKHLPGAARDKLGPMQAEQVSALIERRKLPWNVAFEGGPVAILDLGTLPACRLPGGLTLTLLSPTIVQLRKLRPRWETTIRKAGIAPGDSPRALERFLRKKRRPSDLLGDKRPDLKVLARMPFSEDRSVANGASIAVLLEFEGHTCLLAADALPGVLETTVTQLNAERDQRRLPLDALKVAHHGGRKNTSPDLLRRLLCRRYLFSTNGERYNHPDRETVARVIQSEVSRPELYFNYRTEQNILWDDHALKSQYRYATSFPDGGAAGLIVALDR